MTKNLKTTILFLVHFTILNGVYGQNSANITDYLSQKFVNYCKSVPREEIFIHSDRDEYISGEDIWFSIYSIDRQSFKSSLLSKIAYIELLNAENRPVIQKRIFLNAGFGPGHIVLPDTLSSGTYTLRAYTNWMKNFLPYNCFMKEINIHNAFSNKIIKGRSSSYKFVFKEGQPDQRSSVSGVTLKADNQKQGDLEILVSSDEKYRSEYGNHFYLFIQTHGNINFVGSEMMTGDNTKLYIPKNQLSAGVNQITLFNSKGRPAGECYIFTPEKDWYDIKIQTPDSSSRRNKIRVNLQISDNFSAYPNYSNLSVSVAAMSDFHSGIDLNDYMIFGTEFGFIPWNIFYNRKTSGIAPESIDSLLRNVKSNWINWDNVLADEYPVFKNNVEGETHYLNGQLFDSNHKLADSDRFVILSKPGKIPTFQYARTDKNGNFSFKINISDELQDLIIQPDGDAKNQILNIESSFYDQYPGSSGKADTTARKLERCITDWGVNYQVQKIYGVTSVGDPVPLVIPQHKVKRFYGKPESELLLKDYITLPVMQEVFFELLVGVFLKNKKTEYEVTINNPDNNQPYDRKPSLFVDGVLVKDAAVIAAIDPELVEKIDVVREKYFVGDYLFYGIINIITRAADFSNISLAADVIRLPYRVVDRVPAFTSPDYTSSEKKNNRTPDFRNTLYWNPSVKTDINGKAAVEFWTSDFVSDYQINIQGISSEGKAFSLRKIVRVKR